MDYEFDQILGLDRLGLSFEAHVCGFDGENFSFNIYVEEGKEKEKYIEIDNAVNVFIKPYADQDIYLGYIDITARDNVVGIYLDLGGVEPQDNDTAINGILKAIDKVTGIKKVLINEDSGFGF